MKKIIAVVVMLCAVMISSTASASEEWTYVCNDFDGNKYFINYASVHSTKGRKGMDDFQFSTLVKRVYSEFGRARFTKNRLSPDLASLASYEIDRVLFKVKNSQKLFRWGDLAVYANDGTILYSGSRSDDYFFSITSLEYMPSLFEVAYSRL